MNTHDKNAYAVFLDAYASIADRIHENAKDKGWWEGGVEGRNFGEMLMLVTCEIAEAMEAWRDALKVSEKIPDFTGVEEELADAIIRIMDMGQALELNIPEAIIAKHQYNRNRPYKHGGKRA